MYYGYVGGDLKTVLTDFGQVKELALKHPYSSYRRFHKEDKAWKWVNNRRNISTATSISRYGNVFGEVYVTMEYIVTDNELYFNFFTPRIGNIFITSENPRIHIENRTNLIKVMVEGVSVGDSIVGHLSAIYQGINILGPYIDVEIIVPDHSIFYALTMYSGTDVRITRIRDSLNQRLASWAVSIDDF